MTVPFSPSLSPLFQTSAIRQAYGQCRQGTLQRIADLPEAILCHQVHEGFSPLGWHLGHIGFTESLWILEHLAGEEGPEPQWRRLWAADGLPKAERQHLPPLVAILDYLDRIRDRVFAYLDRAPLEQEARLWWWLVQHESQHNETMSLLRLLHGDRPWCDRSDRPSLVFPEDEMVAIPGGEAVIGSDGLLALDNETPCHRVTLAPFTMDRHPVTIAAYRQFIEGEGYGDRRWWSEAGWHWCQGQAIAQPLYWPECTDYDDHPVMGVSYYEAEAYSRFVGKALPTEFEWEWAAQAGWTAEEERPWSPTSHRGTSPVALGDPNPWGLYDLTGQVWQWTCSPFQPYPHFEPFPYRGYSQAYFDGEHYVLRGGSWATPPWGVRPTFRNWYQPWVRQILAGFRCVRRHH